ncbi:MAG: sugar transferase [Gemmatimonadetes bacterium]|nr:sugar transferase [Gemmatimonadota bacterium]
MKRSFDFLVAAVLLVLLALPMLVTLVIVKLTSRGPALYWSKRVGRDNVLFPMPKFRTMKVDTPAVATHLLADPDSHLTSVGRLLRRTSFDELPQLVSIVRGDMSLVGPRAALFNQDDLVELRTQRGIHKITPGLTGWAQIHGRDEVPIPIKVEFDEFYLRNQSFWLDIRILVRTALQVIRGDGVAH